MSIERTKPSIGWKFHSQRIFEESTGSKVVDACYSKRWGGLINSLTLYIYPDGQILIDQMRATEDLKNRALRDARKMMPALTTRLKSGDS